MQIYLVGGAVRDKLLGLPMHELDWVVVGATVEVMQEKGFIQVGKDFPVFLHPKTKEEYALARTERKIGVGYTGFSCNAAIDVTLEEDLMRRDLTINAIAQDEHGNLIDPFCGQKDLKNKILRHVSDHFIEDPLRILRIARFMAKFGPEFSIAKETQTLLKKMVKNKLLQELNSERIFKELNRALNEKYPELFFTTLREIGALQVILPELDRLSGVPQKKEYHPEIDTFVHIMLCISLAAKLNLAPEIRFAVLLHDLGKGVTPKEKLPSHHGHDIAGVALVKEVSLRLRAPNEYRELAELVARNHILIHMINDLRAETIVELLERTDAIRRKDRFLQVLMACEVDARGRLGLTDKVYIQRPIWQKIQEEIINLDLTPILQQKLAPAMIKIAIHTARVAKVKEIKDSFGLEPKKHY